MARKQQKQTTNDSAEVIPLEEFLNTPNLEIQIGDTTLECEPREFKTNSYGYFLSGKAPVVINGKKERLQITATMVIIGSKPK